MRQMFGWRFKKAVTTWKQFVEAGNRINSQNPGNFLQINYEHIIRNPDMLIRDIFDFIGETFEEKSVAFLEKPINTAPGRESESSIEKLDPRWENWNFYNHFIFNRHCGETMKTLGY